MTSKLHAGVYYCNDSNMHNDNKNSVKNDSTSNKELTTTRFSLNSLHNRLSIKFSSSSSAATSSTSSTSTSGSNTLKIRKNSHAAFQFLRSKPPINPATNEIPANTINKPRATSPHASK